MFVLKACGRNAEQQCCTCQKQICWRHARHTNEQDTASPVLCLECYTEKNIAALNDKSKPNTSVTKSPRTIGSKSTARDYDYWYHAQRFTFFHNNPSYRSFNEDDYQNFDRQKDAELDDDSKAGNFFDS
jgi:hypothetical protein